MIIVISGPSGVGKSTIIKEINIDKNLYFSVSSTTRDKRTDETEGLDYHFITDEQFNTMIKDSLFAEYEEYGGYKYGTPISELNKESEYDAIILDLEVNGALRIMDTYKNSVGIFIDINNEILKERLMKRGGGNDLFIKTRLELAKEQREYINSFKYHILNNKLESTVKQINDIIYNGIL